MARILCTVTNDLSYDRRMHRICGALAGAGYEVTLVGRQLPDSRPLPRRTFDQRRLPCAFTRGKAFYLEYNLRLLRYLLAAPFDLVCAVDLDTILPALLAARARNKPLVYDAHEYFSEVPEVVSRPLIRRAWEMVARCAIPRADAAYTVGEALAEALEKRYARPFEVVRNMPLRRPNPPVHRLSGPVRLLYQGALNAGRGLEAVLEAMPHLPKAELTLAGEGDRSADLRRLAHRLGITDRVRFLGYVAPENLPALADAADLGLNVLENQGLSYYLSAANKAYDYIQAGLPSLQMDFPEYRKLQEQFGVFYLIQAPRAEAIARAVRRIREAPESYARVADRCRAAGEVLHWGAEEVGLLALYRQLAEPGTKRHRIP